MASNTMTPAELVGNYIKLRDYKKKADEEYKASMERVNQGMEKIESLLLAHLNETGASSVACKGIGTVYKNVQYSATVKDREAFRAFVEAGNWESADLRANKTFVKELATKGTTVPGVELSSVVTVGVRRD